MKMEATSSRKLHDEIKAHIPIIRNIENEGKF